MENGIYRHYKGKLYKVIDVATHSETLEKMVVYRQQYGEYSIWVRPYKMFTEEIEVEGKKVRRFEFVEMDIPY